MTSSNDTAMFFLRSIMKTTFAAVFLVSAVLPLVADAGQIKVCAAVDSVPFADVTVRCWDDDYNSDDFMASGTTDSNGCVTLNYQTKSNGYWWWGGCYGGSWDGCSGGYSNPDIFCEVSGDCIAPKKTGDKNDHNQNQLANFGTVNVVADTDFCGDSSWNGCGPSVFPDWLSDTADSVSGFEDACNSHDVCYGNCGNSRAKCEDEFWDSMYAQCDSGISGHFCRVLADIFHLATYTGGESLCYKGRDDCTAAQQNTCTI
jgi:hypothetical protein